MMRWLVLAATLCASPALAAPEIGTAIARGGKLCMGIDRPGLAAGTPILLVVPDRPQRSLQAEIAPGSTCPQPGYRLRLRHGTAPADLVLAALVDATARPAGGGLLAVEAGGDKLTFRSCTSSDGVHLTAWRGRPLRSTRVWHAYVYLGADLEPDCTAADTDGS